MGLIKAALGAAGGVLADQWKEYFYCDSLPENVLAVKGKKRTSGRSSNTRGSDNIITNGSVIAIADGQCVIIVDQGAVMDCYNVPGEYIYDMSTEPSIFDGDFGESVKKSFQTIGKRFTFGGEPPKDQRIYYMNTKELVGNKYGTPSPVPFLVVDKNIGLELEISVRCFGEYSYRITDPLLFYKNVCGNVSDDFTRDRLEGMMKTELMTALQPAFYRVSQNGIRYSALPGHTMELSEALNDVLSAKWRDLRGIEMVSLGISSIKASEEDEAMLKEMQRNAALRDPRMAAATLAGAQAAAMQSAAKNENGAMMGFMGMNMAGAAGGMNAANMFQMAQQQEMQNQQFQQQQQQYQQPAPAAPAADSWICSCGQTATGKFCPNCGAKKPEPKPAEGGWTCPTCGKTAFGKFCPECGTKKPEVKPDGWVCSQCGATNKGKFCSECGAKKPAGVPQFKCDKCGWEPKDPAHPPKFCPECGDPFDDGDLIV